MRSTHIARRWLAVAVVVVTTATGTAAASAAERQSEFRLRVSTATVSNDSAGSPAIVFTGSHRGAQNVEIFLSEKLVTRAVLKDQTWRAEAKLATLPAGRVTFKVRSWNSPPGTAFTKTRSRSVSVVVPGTPVSTTTTSVQPPVMAPPSGPTTTSTPGLPSTTTSTVRPTTSTTTTKPPVAATVGSVSGFSPGGGFPYLSDSQLAKDLDGIKATGAQWVRVDFPWSSMEPAKGAYSWSNLDRVTNAAAARGIKVLALPAYSPNWARPGCGTDKCPPVNPDDYATFVAAAARHFGPDRVQAWELWNEPNIPSFWSPKPNVDAYATLMSKSASALRAARPDAFILSGGLSPAYSDGTNIAPVDFIKRLYALGAMKNIDAVALHPYSDKSLPLAAGTESWNTFLQMKAVHDVMAANGDGNKQVWGTEFGVATGTSGKSTSEAQQAAIIAQGYQRLADGSWPWLGTLFAYSLRDHADNISDWQSNYGLLRNNGSPKPAYTTFTNAMKQPLVR